MGIWVTSRVLSWRQSAAKELSSRLWVYVSRKILCSCYVHVMFFRTLQVLRILQREAAMLARSWDRILLFSQSIRLSVRHTRALWRNERPYCQYFDTTWRVITLVFWCQQRLVDDVLNHLKFSLKLTHPRWKTPTSTICLYNVWTVRASEKCSIIANRKLTRRFPTNYRQSA